MQNLAEVRLWGELVGALAYDPATAVSTFEYAPDWLAQGVDIAPIKMPLAETLYSFPALNSQTFRGLPPVFADTLPDDFGNAVIDAWLARQGRDAHSFTPLERLLYTGNRGMGALEYATATGLRCRPGPDPLRHTSFQNRDPWQLRAFPFRSSLPSLSYHSHFLTDEQHLVRFFWL